MSTTFSPAQALANAIAQNEGYGIPDAIPTLANNPGDLELGDIGYGTMTAAGGNQITVYPSAAAGSAALLNQTNLMINGGSSVYSPNETISQAAQTYTGSSTAGSTWASKLGVSPDSTLGSLANAAQSAANTVASAGQTVASAASNPVPLWQKVVNWLDGGAVQTATTVETRIAFVIIGLLLIAAGIFAFDRVRATTAQAGGVIIKKVKEGSEAALAVGG